MTTSSLAAVANAAAGQSNTPEAAGTASAGGISQAHLDAAVATAEANGREAGATAERDRLTAVLSTEGIAGNAARMGHALELASAAPAMTAEKIAALTTKHIVEAANQAPGMSLEERQSDADPIGGAASGDVPEATGLSKLVAARVERMNKPV